MINHFSTKLMTQDNAITEVGTKAIGPSCGFSKFLTVKTGVKISATDTACSSLNKDLTFRGYGIWQFLDDKLFIP
tara:strand:- start:17790 stop:18014 length:225 start_codon:yes stop_codon:yes gene_type:complete